MFESIQGQDDAVKQMNSALKNPVNTYVFYGSRGTYVEESARLFASRLLNNDGSCDQRVASRVHPDAIEYEPSGITYRIKEDVRESMLDELRKSPVEGKNKALIVHDAHLLRDDSANAMLKSLEEPPENFYWILIAPNVDSLISTIRSRSFSITFSRLSEQLIAKKLVEEGINTERATLVASMAGGRLDRARKLAGHYWPIRELATEIVNETKFSASTVTNSSSKILGAFEEITSDVAAENKTKLEEVKANLKDSGYADKIVQSIITSHKKNIEAQEKKLKSELINELLDALEYEYSIAATKATSSGDEKKAAFCVNACEQIEASRKRLVFNPSEALFIESLFASIVNMSLVNS